MTCTGFASPPTYTVTAFTLAFQKKSPVLSLWISAYFTWVGSFLMIAEGCRPIPRTEGMVLEPGRSRAREKNRAEGADPEGVMLKRLEENAAPSATSDEPEGIWEEM